MTSEQHRTHIRSLAVMPGNERTSRLGKVLILFSFLCSTVAMICESTGQTSPKTMIEHLLFRCYWPCKGRTGGRIPGRGCCRLLGRPQVGRPRTEKLSPGSAGPGLPGNRACCSLRMPGPPCAEPRHCFSESVLFSFI